MKVKGNHPLAEIIAKKLFGIEQDGIPKEYRTKMVRSAVKSAVKWSDDKEKEIRKDQDKITRFACAENILKVCEPGERVAITYVYQAIINTNEALD